ncbi:hypothetical protein B0H34DRAFT_797183 [Crassisporium funariophilum]|nr:hypothetical protein B0H34DRAFT_797183 [Crassisporium funariophilum]
MEGKVRSVRTYKKTPVITVPEPPEYLGRLVSPASSSSLSPSPNNTRGPSSTILGSPFIESGRPNEPSSQPRLRQSPQSDSQKLALKFEKMDALLRDWGFDSVGEFLQVLFHNPTRATGQSDPRGSFHAKAVSRFLQGRNNVKMSDIIPLVYGHKHSAPSPGSPSYSERRAPFSPIVSPGEILHARPSLFSWATNLVADHVHREIYTLTAKNDSTHLRASTNGRHSDHANVVTWDALGKFSISALIEKYKTDAPVSWHLTESMAALRKNGSVVLKKRRPHPIVLVGAISAFILARDHYANGYLAMALGVWHFAAKSHIDVKRVYSRLGNIVSDTTVRIALDSLTGSSLASLRTAIQNAMDRGETEWCLIIDNVQEYCPVYEGGIARESVLKVVTAGTAIRLDDCKPGAFDLQSYLLCVVQKERINMTVISLWNDIDWSHQRAVQALHWTRVLVGYVPELDFLSPDISARFRSTPIAKHRMCEGRKTVVQPLGTNAEREIETQGMARALRDFDEQMGVVPEAADKLLSWVRGDGASYATTLRLQKYLCAVPDNYESFRNCIAIPEIWHAKATMINSIAANHYGPATSKDPSSLSRSSTLAGFKRPSNLSSCDFYPTVRSMTLIWEAQVLDCWRVHLDATPDLLLYFKSLASSCNLPSLDTLLRKADILVGKYASQDAYEQALSGTESREAKATMKIKSRPTTTAQGSANASASTVVIETETHADENTEADPPFLPTENVPKVYQEVGDFDGDQVLANSILFLQDFGWWIEISYAVPEGDIGRAFEILKIWIFMFAGSSHQNYMTYLLETFVMLQEHYNRWLEDQVQKRGGDFDDKFYRSTLSPNVNHFLRIKEEIENAFDLSSRAKTHTSPHLRAELRLLLALFKEEFLHLFCTGRTLGHAAGNQLNHGFDRLQTTKLADFINKSTAYADVLADILALKHNEKDAPILEEEVQRPADAVLRDDINTDPPGTDISSESDISAPEPSGSLLALSTSSSYWSDNNEPTEVDPSNDHLVSGSEYNIYMTENRLAHRTWDEQANEADYSDDGDEENRDFDVALLSDVENGQDAQDNQNSYDSDEN